MEYDLRSHSNKRLGSILANPRHPAHSAAKAERDRRLAMRNEAYDEPQGQAKRMMSPLQKMRMDKEKADRDRDGKLKPGVVKRGKSTMNRLKDIRQRADAFAVKSRKEEVDLDEMKDEWKTDTGWKKPETIRKDRFGNVIKNLPKHLAKAAAKKSAEMNKEEVEQVDEVLDRPGAMDKYHNKAKAQSDRARNSATAKILRGNSDISKEKETIRKREKGMDMATNVRAKQFRRAVTGRPYGEAVEEDMNPYLKHSTDKLKNKHASFSRQIGDLQTKKLKGAKNPSIDQEIAKYQQKLRHVKNAMKNESIEEAKRKGAPKMQGDWLKKEREKNRAHDAAMGRTPTGRKKPERAMTSTQRSLAKMRAEDVEYVNEKKLTPKEVKRALASIKPPKKKPTLPKAPWEKEKTEEGFVSHAQRKAVWATKKDGGKGHPDNKKKNEAYVPEGLTVGDGMGSWIKDFQASDAPQFAGKSQKKKRDMAIAAYLDAKRSKKESVEEASVINGKKQDPNSTRWKSTSLSHADAVAKHGKDNVRKGMFKRGDGSHDVQVKSKLGEENIDEKKGLTIPKFRSALYKGAKALGDVQAVKKKKVGKRIGRRVVGKMAGRLLGKMFR